MSQASLEEAARRYVQEARAMGMPIEEAVTELRIEWKVQLREELYQIEQERLAR